MFFKKELYIGKDDEFLNLLVGTLEKKHVKTKIVHSSFSHGFDVPRGTAVGRYRTQDSDMISIYVKSKDFSKALGILNSLNNS